MYFVHCLSLGFEPQPLHVFGEGDLAKKNSFPSAIVCAKRPGLLHRHSTCPTAQFVSVWQNVHFIPLLFLQPCLQGLYYFLLYCHVQSLLHSCPSWVLGFVRHGCPFFSLHSLVSRSLLRAFRRWSTITRYAITAMWNRMYHHHSFFSPLTAGRWQHSAGLTAWNSSLAVSFIYCWEGHK